MTNPAFLLSSLLVLLILLAGCGEPSVALNAPALPSPAPSAQPAHARSGPHGGALIPLGNDHVEILYEEPHSRLVVSFFNADATSLKGVNAAALSAQFKVSPDGQFQTLTFAPLPLEGQSSELCSRFAAPAPNVKSEFEIVLRLRSGDAVFRAHALLDPATIASTKFVCPMNCYDGKLYPLPGNCPKCGMKLVEATSGAQPHSDHRPRHGGVFFMSADNWHHLEGVFAPPDEFRLYFYDNFTRPMDAGSFDGTVEFESKIDAAEKPASATQKLQPGPGRAYLTVKVPPTAALPLRVTVHVKLKPEQPPELFNFSFSDWAPPKP